MPFRDKKYLEYIRSFPCIVCGSRSQVQAHHHGRRGIGQKTDDYRTVPLCSQCHYDFHKNRFRKKLKDWDDCDFKEIQLTLLIQYFGKE